MQDYKKDIKLLYAGGTFGGHGNPITPLPTEKFMPVLLKKTKSIITANIEIIENELIKDSSHLSPEDFYIFYQKILTEYKAGYKKFILISGTDTLSYLAAFLHECFFTEDITICITASMTPLLFTDQREYVVNNNSDAWCNFLLAIQSANSDRKGVFVCIHDNILVADSVQKLHSMDKKAFVGTLATISEPSTKSDIEKNNQPEHFCVDRYKLQNNINNYLITPVYLYPTVNDTLLDLLQIIIQQAVSKDKTACIVIIGFGTGNIPYSDELVQFFQESYDNNHLLFITTQCSFDGVNQAYAAGSWLHGNHILSCGAMTKELVFSRILFLSMVCNNVKDIREEWHQRLK